MPLPNWNKYAFKSASCPIRSPVLRLIEASYLKPDSPRTSPGNESAKQSRRRIIVRVLWWCCRHEAIHDTITWNQHYFAFIRPCAPLVYKYYVISWNQNHSADLFVCFLFFPSGSTDKWQRLLNIAQKQLTYSGFLQHINVNKFYIHKETRLVKN